MSNKTMQFLYGDRELLLTAGDLLAAETSVIVNSTDSELKHDNDFSINIINAAGTEIATESQLLIQQYGKIDSGMPVYTTAGELDYLAVIHIVPPEFGEGDEQAMLERSISRSLLICETNDWNSIAFPALGVAHNNIPVELCAQAFFRAITSFWDARFDNEVEKIVLCLGPDQFDAFFHAFRNDAIETIVPVNPANEAVAESEKIGYIDLKDIDTENPDDDISDWFK